MQDNIIDYKKHLDALRDKALKSQELEGNLDSISPIISEYPNRQEAEKYSLDLKEMNLRYAFVKSVGGKPLVKSMVYNEFFGREIVEFISPDAIQMIYANRMATESITDPRKRGIPLGKWWLGHPHRKEYETVTFEPGKPAGEYYIIDNIKVSKNDETEDKHKTYFNTWEGFGVTPKKGSWKHTCKHIYKILCNGNRKKFDYIIKWFAWAVQNPGKRAEVAIIFKGKKGTGKGIILKAFVRMFGRHGMTVANPAHLLGKHNDHLASCCFLFADEVYNPQNVEMEGVLKNLITEPSILVEPKFRSVKLSNNCLHIAMATNADWIVQASDDERRYFINEVENKWVKGQIRDDLLRAYFKPIWDELDMEGGCAGISAMMYDLQKMELGDWHPRTSIPETEEMKRQIAMSLPKLRNAFLSLLEEGTFPGSLDNKERYLITNRNLTEYIQKMEEGNRKITTKQVAQMCRDMGIEMARSGKEGNRHVFPELGELRQRFDERVSKHDYWRLNEQWTVTKQY